MSDKPRAKVKLFGTLSDGTTTYAPGTIVELDIETAKGVVGAKMGEWASEIPVEAAQDFEKALANANATIDKINNELVKTRANLETVTAGTTAAAGEIARLKTENDSLRAQLAAKKTAKK